MKGAICCTLLFLGWVDIPTDYDIKVAEAFAEFEEKVEEIRVATETTNPDRLTPILVQRRGLWKAAEDSNFYERIDNGFWVEQSPQGDALFYREITRTESYVEIASGNDREYTIIRLYEDRADVKQSRTNKFKTFYQGTWKQ